MENQTASELIKKLVEGKISREEFELFLAKLDDKQEAKNLDEGFWQLFSQHMPRQTTESKEDRNPKE